MALAPSRRRSHICFLFRRASEAVDFRQKPSTDAVDCGWTPSQRTTTAAYDKMPFLTPLIYMSYGNLVPLARPHPLSHGVGPSRRRSHIRVLFRRAIEAVDFRYHLRRQPVMVTDDP